MSKFVEIEYYPWIYGSGNCYADNGKPYKHVINIDMIARIPCKPVTKKLYKSYEHKETSTSVEMWELDTQIAYGCGINGVGYEHFYMTKASFDKLMDVLDIA